MASADFDLDSQLETHRRRVSSRHVRLRHPHDLQFSGLAGQGGLRIRRQSHRAFELVIADDGSTAETEACIDLLRRATDVELHHVWHAKRGFGKCRILNHAIRKATGDYLVFSDGDCIPRVTFWPSTCGSRAAATFYRAAWCGCRGH